MKSSVSTQMNEKSTRAKSHPHDGLWKFACKFFFGNPGKDIAHDTRGLAKLGYDFGSCSRAMRKLRITIAHISCAAKDRSDVVLEVSGNVHRQVTGGIRHAGQGLPKSLVIGI
jgi:hypothetical protein